VFEYADGGTLFLDEIGDTPLTMQAKLLRVLETGEIVRLGSNEPRKTDVRFISATNQDMKTMVGNGKFREDLYFRIKGTEIHVPPLRERRDDIPRLVQFGAGKFAAELNRPVPTISEPAMMRLVAYHWPGNVRELLNTVQRMVVMCEDNSIDVRHVPDDVRTPDADDSSSVGSLAGVGLDKLEKEAIRQTLAMTAGNREQAAHLLGIGERTLYRKLKEYGVR
jgi:two-component system response regulator HydG